jgi:hypothetical protein
VKKSVCVGRLWNCFALSGLLLVLINGTCTAETKRDDRDGASPRSYQGILKTGIVAIGGETTGVTLATDNDGVFELDFGRSERLQRLSEKLNGKKVTVMGDYKPRPGVEVKERRIILVKTLVAAN